MANAGQFEQTTRPAEDRVPRDGTPRGKPSPMPHRIVRTFHSTCMVNSYDRTVAALGHVAGLRVLEYSEAPAIGRRGGMTWIGDGSIEVAEPIVPGHAAARFLERFGPACIRAPSRSRTSTQPSSTSPAVGSKSGCAQRPASASRIHAEPAGSCSSGRTSRSPRIRRIGAPEPPHPDKPVLDVLTHAFIGALVPEPSKWADDFGELFGLVETLRDPKAAPDQPVVCLAAPDCVLALFRLTPETSAQYWGTVAYPSPLSRPGIGSPLAGLRRPRTARRRRRDTAAHERRHLHRSRGNRRGTADADRGTPDRRSAICAGDRSSVELELEPSLIGDEGTPPSGR